MVLFPHRARPVAAPEGWLVCRWCGRAVRRLGGLSFHAVSWSDG